MNNGPIFGHETHTNNTNTQKPPRHKKVFPMFRGKRAYLTPFCWARR